MYRIIFIILLFLLATSSTPFATPAQDTNFFELGKHFFKNKDYEKSYEAFYKAFLENPSNLNISFYLGRSAYLKGDYEAALMAFDRILIMDPNATRIKLEIALCHYALGAFEPARLYFYEVLETNPPKKVRENIQIVLATMASAEKRHFISGMLAIDLTFDDNVRTSPASDAINVLWENVLIPFTPDPPVKDEIINTTAVVSHIYQKAGTNYSWKTTALNYNSLYNDFKDLNLTVVGLTSGPAIKTENYLFEINGLFNNIDLAYDEYMRQTGATASVYFSLAPQLIIATTAGFNKKKYSRLIDIERDATNYNMSITPTLVAGKNRFSFSFWKERENADIIYNSYDRFKFTFRYDRGLPNDFNLFTSFSLNMSDYDSQKPTEPAIRSDTIHDLSVGATKLLHKSKDKKKNVNLQMKHSYTEAKSTVETYTYRKNTTSASLNFTF